MNKNGLIIAAYTCIGLAMQTPNPSLAETRPPRLVKLLCQTTFGESLNVSTFPTQREAPPIHIREYEANRKKVIRILDDGDGRNVVVEDINFASKMTFSGENADPILIATDSKAGRFTYPADTRLFPGGSIDEQVEFNTDVNAFYLFVQEGSQSYVDVFDFSQGKIKRKSRVKLGELELLQGASLTETWSSRQFVVLGYSGDLRKFVFRLGELQLVPHGRTFKTRVRWLVSETFQDKHVELVDINGSLGLVLEDRNLMRLYDCEKEKWIGSLDLSPLRPRRNGAR